METIRLRPRSGKGSESLTILAVSDEVSTRLYDHFEPEEWRHVDLVISCGDLPPDYLDFLASSLNVPLLYVRGNHDGQYPASAYQGMDNVHGRIVTCRGLRIAGFEGSRRYNDGPVQYTDREMRRLVVRSRLKALGRGPADIVVTHAPPLRVHDGADVCHRGFDSFRGLIHAWHPSLFLHGHMHSYERGDRDTVLGRTHVVHVFPYTVLQVPLPVPTALAG